jgi:hypothetical protein
MWFWREKILQLFSGTKWDVLSSYVKEFWNSEFQNRNSDLMTFQQRNSKKFWPEYPESETESEFCFRWGSQKSEPKIGIPNQGNTVLSNLWNLGAVTGREGLQVAQQPHHTRPAYPSCRNVTHTGGQTNFLVSFAKNCWLLSKVA